MPFQFIFQQALKWLLVAAFFSNGPVMAQSEPTLAQVYAAAQSGQLDQAQRMIQQVLMAHPQSAKAYFVQSELEARQAHWAKARTALATAEKLAPGLPFAKAQAVQALRTQLAGAGAPVTVSGGMPYSSATSPGGYAAPAGPVSSPLAWVLPLLLAGGVIGLGYVLFRKKQPEPFAQQTGFTSPNGLHGPQIFGSSAAAPYAQPAYSAQGGMSGPQAFGMGGGGAVMPTPSGLGGRVMGGLATGLAVGAGVMAAEAIGRNLMGSHTQAASPVENLIPNDFLPLDNNPDMGGADFGINDTSSWDSGSGDAGGTSDWDV